MEYYSVIRKNEILPFGATQMNLENNMISGISQTEKDKYCMISPIGESKTQNKRTKTTKQKQSYRWKTNNCCWRRVYGYERNR